MKLRYLFSSIFISVLLITACDGISKEEVNNKETLASFGLKWEMTVDELKQNNNNLKIEYDQSTCPFIEVKANKLKDGLNNDGEQYKLYFLPKNEHVKMNGLVGIEYIYSTENEKLANLIEGDFLKNLELRYGNPIKKNSDDGYSLVFENKISRVLFGFNKYEKQYVMVLFNYNKKVFNTDMDKIVEKVNLECKKERNPL